MPEIISLEEKMQKKPVRFWPILALTILFTYLLMVMGTFVTSTGSGLACPDWPLCYGTVAPPLEVSIWFEWGHRLLGGVSSILILTSTIMVLKRYKGLPKVMMLSVLGLLAMGVVMGAITVIVEAPLLSTFSHVAIISSHLVIATLVLICLVFTLRYVVRGRGAAKEGYFKLLFGVIYLQVILGIVVRYAGATLACPDVPFCNGSLVPDLGNYMIALHFMHRLTALIVVVVAVASLYRAIKDGSPARDFAIALGLVLFQAAWGISIVVSGMFLPFIILHAATGFLLLGFVAYKSMPYLFKIPVRGETERV